MSKEDGTSKLENIAAERTVLAGMIQFGNDIYHDIEPIISEDSFTDSDNVGIYKIVKSLSEDNIKCDISTIISKAHELNLKYLVDNSDGLGYLKSLQTYGVSKSGIVQDAKTIRKLSVIRHGQDVARDIYKRLQKLDGSHNIDEILSSVESPVFDFISSCSESQTKKVIKAGDCVHEFLAYVEENRGKFTAVPSPFKILDEAIGGGRRNGYVYLTAARPKVGKSSLSINDALFVTQMLDIPVLYLDSEMHMEGQLPRILGNLSGIDCTQIENGAFLDKEFDKKQIAKGAKVLKGLPFYYLSISNTGFKEILSKIKRWIVQSVGMNGQHANQCLIIYDYFKLMDSSSLNKLSEHQALGFQIQELTELCNKYMVPCHAFVQLNRNGAEDPTSSDISQSDRLLWNCASLCILARKTLEELTEENGSLGNMKLYVSEDQRFGPGLSPGNWLNLSFDKAKCIVKECGTRFDSVEKDDNNSGGFGVELGEEEYGNEDEDWE